MPRYLDQRFNAFLIQIWEDGYQAGLEAHADQFDAALTDAQESGRRVGRSEFINELVDALSVDGRRTLIHHLEESND